MMRSLSQTLFDPALQQTQAHEIARVRRSIGGLVVRFCTNCLLGAPYSDGRPAGAFYMWELEAFAGGTPGSAGRILRLLRKEGVVDYVLISRSDAYYRVLSVKEGA